MEEPVSPAAPTITTFVTAILILNTSIDAIQAFNISSSSTLYNVTCFVIDVPSHGDLSRELRFQSTDSGLQRSGVFFNGSIKSL